MNRAGCAAAALVCALSVPPPIAGEGLALAGEPAGPEATALADAALDTLRALGIAGELGAAALDGIDAMARLLEQEAVRQLAAAIRTAEEQALAAGTRPLPPAIRARLQGRFAPAVLDAARWRIDPGRAGLASLAFGLGHADALALGRVVLFRDEASAGGLVLWAHELVHLEQYRRWGIEGFARRYLHDHAAVEAEAHARTAGLAEPD